MKSAMFAIMLALTVPALSSFAQDAGGQPPGGGAAPGAGVQGGPGGGGPGQGHGGFHLLPPRAMEQLNLTDDQKKQLADLETEVKAKVEKILTPDQLEKMKQMRPPMRQGGGQGFGGQGGPGGGGQGGSGGGGDQPNRQRPASE